MTVEEQKVKARLDACDHCGQMKQKEEHGVTQKLVFNNTSQSGEPRQVTSSGATLFRMWGSKLHGLIRGYSAIRTSGGVASRPTGVVFGRPREAT